VAAVDSGRVDSRLAELCERLGAPLRGLGKSLDGSVCKQQRRGRGHQTSANRAAAKAKLSNAAGNAAKRAAAKST
jgi:hypothetical protein